MTAALIIVVALVFLLVLLLFSALKVAREYERAIVFRLGRLFPEPKGPGLFILIPVVDRMVRVYLHLVAPVIAVLRLDPTALSRYVTPAARLRDYALKLVPADRFP